MKRKMFIGLIGYLLLTVVLIYVLNEKLATQILDGNMLVAAELVGVILITCIYMKLLQVILHIDRQEMKDMLWPCEVAAIGTATYGSVADISFIKGLIMIMLASMVLEFIQKRF